jgi:molybdenum cofactor cytidylyltransferase
LPIAQKSVIGKKPIMIGTIILAAGASTRLGGNPKQLIVYQGQTLLTRTVLAALDCNGADSQSAPVVVVTGGNRSQIEAELINLPATVVYNPDWQTGMASSVQAGLTTLLSQAPDIEAVMMLLTDQPHVSAALLRQVEAVFKQLGKGIVGCQYAGQVGVPALFSQKYFSELLALTGDRGAKPLMMKHADDCATIDFAEGAIDLDTPEEVARFLGELRPNTIS